MSYMPVLGVIGYVLSPDGSQVLMMHRNKRTEMIDYGKYTGLGGKLHNDENIVEGLRREIWEESGLHIDQWELRGTLSWPGFGQHGHGWFVCLFLITAWHGDQHEGNAEGTLEWVPLADLWSRALWESDRLFLPLVFDDNTHPFHGIQPWRDGEIYDWRYERG